MSVVYAARDLVLNKMWAAKEIKSSDDPVTRDLIAKSIVIEANMIKRFDHPAIPRIVDVVDEDGTLFVIMDHEQRELSRSYLRIGLGGALLGGALLGGALFFLVFMSVYGALAS